MSQYEDLIAKLILQVALETEGQVNPEMEVPLLDAQSADFYFAPGPGPRNQARSFRLLNRMTSWRCIFEPYSKVVTQEHLFRGCLRRHFQIYHNLSLEAERRKLPVAPIQWMWVLCPGRPRQLFRALDARRDRRWPAGFYQIGRGLGVWCVVLPELARTRETLLLRMLGPSEMRQAAIAEVRRIPASDPEGESLASLLGTIQYMIDKDPKVPREDKEEFMNSIRVEFERFKSELKSQGIQEGLDKGRGEGRTEGRALALLQVLAARNIPVPEPLRQRIMGCTDSALLDRWLSRAATASTTDEVVGDS